MSSITGATSQFADMATPTADRAGAGLGKSVSAWRRILEREQLAALAKFHSVAEGGEQGMGGAGTPYAQPRLAVPVMADAPLTSSRNAVRSGPESVQASWARSALYQNPNNFGNQSTPSGELYTGVRTSQTSTRTLSAEGMPARLASSVLTNAAMRLSAEWPLRKLHWIADADGIHVWLRDTSMGAQDDVLREWIVQLRQTLTQSGARLASVTLNGVAISPIA